MGRGQADDLLAGARAGEADMRGGVAVEFDGEERGGDRMESFVAGDGAADIGVVGLGVVVFGWGFWSAVLGGNALWTG